MLGRMSRSRWATAAVVARALAGPLAGPAGVAGAHHAEGHGGGSDGRGSPPPDFEAGAQVPVPVPGGPGLPGSDATICTAPGGVTGPISHQPPPLPQEHYFEQAAEYFPPAAMYPGGTWAMRFCGSAPDQIVYVPGNGVGPSLALLEDIATLAVAPPEIHMSPDEDGEQLVNLETWLWVDDAPWEPVTVTNGDMAGLVIELTARPEHVTWDMGDGTAPFRCDRGTPYDPAKPDDAQEPTCSHTYRKSSARANGGAFTVRATVRWTATYTVNDQAGTMDIPAVDKTSTFRVVVDERQALNTST